MKYVRFQNPIVMHATLELVNDGTFTESSILHFQGNADKAVRMRMTHYIRDKFVPLKGKYKNYSIDERGIFIYHIEYNGVDVLVWEEEDNTMGMEAEERTFLPDEMFEI